MSKKLKASNKKLNSLPTISKEMAFCLNHGVKVYPVFLKNSWFIESDVKGKIKTFDKKVTHDEIQESVIKTYLYYYNQLIKLK